MTEAHEAVVKILYVPVSLLLIVVSVDWLLHVPGLRIRTGGAVAPDRSPATG
jgi:hypothetical protein